MRSADKDVALAGSRAFARIGRKPATAIKFPDTTGLPEWQKTDHMDSMLRYADAQAQQGNLVDATRIYKQAMDRPEEQWQCAGVIGIAKMGTPEAAAAIFPKLKSGDRKVRITAQNAWNGIAKAAAAQKS